MCVSKMSFFFISLFFVISSFFLLPKIVFADCNYPNFCNVHTATALNPNDPNPGDDCVIQGVTDARPYPTPAYGYKFDSTTHCGTLGIDWLPGPSQCVPRCGFLGIGRCCVPKNVSDVPPNPTTVSSLPPCKHYGDKAKNEGCLIVDTAFGPIQTDAAGLVQGIFTILLGLSGGVAILLVIAAGYQLMTSQGNPEKVKEGRERLIAAIVGLLFIIFSAAILQIIGVDLLHLPGFSRS